MPQNGMWKYTRPYAICIVIKHNVQTPYLKRVWRPWPLSAAAAGSWRPNAAATDPTASAAAVHGGQVGGGGEGGGEGRRRGEFPSFHPMMRMVRVLGGCRTVDHTSQVRGSAGRVEGRRLTRRPAWPENQSRMPRPHPVSLPRGPARGCYPTGRGVSRVL